MSDGDLKIWVDGKQMNVSAYYRAHGHQTLPRTVTLAGCQIKAFAGADSSYQLYQEEGDGDKMWGDSDPVVLHSGDQFYTAPPCTGS